MLRAIYPGTFDPITRGHEDLLRRASHMFDEVIMAVAESRAKKPLFTLNERIEMAQTVLADCPNIRVIGFTGLLMHTVRAQGARVIVRGLRAASDFEYEFQMAGMNRKLHPDVETIFLTPSEEFIFVSATMVREIAMFGGDIHQVVHPHVLEKLQNRVQQLPLSQKS